MTNNEQLLVIAMGECNEVSKAISKALRFGMKNFCAEKDDIVDNNYKILEEYIQLQTVMNMLVQRNILTPLPDAVSTAIRIDKENKIKAGHHNEKDNL